MKEIALFVDIQLFACMKYVYKLVIHERERERETVKCQCTNKIVENNFGFLLLFLAYWGTKWYPFSMLFNPANM